MVVTCGVALLIHTPATAAAIPAKRQVNLLPATTGNDISWPQCVRISPLPISHTFTIVGVNNGKSDSTNPCFAQELEWAKHSSGGTGQPKVLLYVNTSNPGDTIPATADWPTSNFDVTEPSVPVVDPYGPCHGSDDTACSWQYGYNMAALDADARGVPAPSAYHWYLDVETVNSWTSSTTLNAADLEGMVTYFRNIGITVGLYSTRHQWQDIVGSDYDRTKDVTGNILDNLPSWVPGADDEASAKTNCSARPFTAGGNVVISQYLSIQDDLDFDVSCT